MSKIDDLIDEWAWDVVRNMHKSGYSGINVVEKILRDPGISTNISRDRILWWPRTKRIAKIYRAMHQIDPIDQICLIVNSGHVRADDGSVFDKYKLAKYSSLGVRRFNSIVKKNKLKLSEILRG